MFGRFPRTPPLFFSIDDYRLRQSAFPLSEYLLQDPVVVLSVHCLLPEKSGLTAPSCGLLRLRPRYECVSWAMSLYFGSYSISKMFIPLLEVMMLWLLTRLWYINGAAWL